MTRSLFALAAVAALAAGASADDKPKFPDLKAKEWKTLDNGMKQWEVAAGKGDECPKGVTVTIHYTGWLTDGTEFDSSKKSGRNPVEFPLALLVKGWQEGVPGMKPGGIRRLYVPAQLGYGAKGAGGAIPPDATLVFVIELIDVKK